MSDLPAAAIEAATWALHGRSKDDPSGAMDGICACHGAEEHDVFLAEDEAAAKAALEAAAPHLAAAERARLREPVTTLTDWLEHLPQRHVPLRAAEALLRPRNLTAPGDTP